MYIVLFQVECIHMQYVFQCVSIFTLFHCAGVPMSYHVIPNVILGHPMSSYIIQKYIQIMLNNFKNIQKYSIIFNIMLNHFSLFSTIIHDAFHNPRWPCMALKYLQLLATSSSQRLPSIRPTTPEKMHPHP